MIKKAFLTICILLLTVSCSLFKKSENEEIDKILYDTMESKRDMFIGNDKLLYKDINVTDEEKTIIDKYVYVDLDEDDINELVVLDKSSFGLYIILRYDKDNDKVYGYKVSYRGLEELKTDGTFLSSGGASNTYYCKLMFNGGEHAIVSLAHFDSTENEYELNGKKVSKEEVEAFASVFDNKENVKWIEYKS